MQAFLNRPLEFSRYPYVYLDATYLHGRDQSRKQVISRAVIVAVGITATGQREVLGIEVGDSEDETFWTAFLRRLRERGLSGVQLVISDAHAGLKKAIARCCQGCSWQRCRVHFARNLLAKVPKGSQDMVAAALRSVFVQQDEPAVEQQWDQVITMLTENFPAAAALMEQAREDVLAFRVFPPEHWRKIWSTNPLERLNKEIKRRTRVVGIFPNDAAITRLVGALLLEQQEEWQLDGQAGQDRRSAPRSTNSCTCCSCLITDLRSGHKPRGLHHSKGRNRQLPLAALADALSEAAPADQDSGHLSILPLGDVPGHDLAAPDVHHPGSALR